MTSGRLLAKNSAFNLAGQLVPLVVAFVTIPLLVRGFGAERFGVLTLGWAATGYFGLFELGLGRALTQAIAQRLGAGQHDDLPSVAWTSLLLLFALGVAGGVALAAASPVLVVHVLNVPSELRREAIVAFWILAATMPLIVTTAGLRGIMEAHQHFGISTMFRIPLVGFMFFGPVLTLPFSSSLVPAVWTLVIGRIVGFCLYLVACLRIYPYLRSGVVVRRESIGPLLRFGGWTTVSNIVSPIMVTMDRFLVGAVLPLAAVAHYVTPYEAITKASFIPMAIAGVMFPAFASTAGRDPERLTQLYHRSLRVVVLALFPAVLVAIALAREALQLWIGPLLPMESARVLQWLALGVFVNGIAQCPLVALQGAARPDLVAKLHLLELPLYAGGILLLMQAFGLTGVAIAWTCRVTFDTIALLVLARRQLNLSMSLGLRGDLLVLLSLGTFIGAAALQQTNARVLFVAIALIVFVPLGWLGLLEKGERMMLRHWLRGPSPAAVTGTETP